VGTCLQACLQLEEAICKAQLGLQP